MNENRPFVICHMLTSLDGKIDGSFFRAAACGPALMAYGQLRKFYDCQATLYGTVIMLGSYSDGLAPALEPVETMSREDWFAQRDVSNYIVSVDPEGTLGFNCGYIENKGRPKAHVIEVLTEQVSDSYLHYLRNQGVSYIFAGREHLDCRLLLKKLANHLGIEKLMIAGGGYMNYSFLHEDLIDELSIVVAPVADGNTSSVSIFEQSAFLPNRTPVAFSLIEAKALEGDALWLRYALKRQEDRQ